MNIIYFILAFVAFVYVSFLWGRMYLLIAVLIQQYIHKSISWVIVIVWLMVYSSSLIIMFFFPLWLAEKTRLMVGPEGPTLLFFFLGMFTMGFSAWRAWLSNEGKRFKMTFDQ